MVRKTLTPIEARRQIDLHNREFEAHFAAQDAEALVVGYFLPDADGPMASPPGSQPLVKGRTALVSLFRAQFAAVRSIRLETVCLETSGSLAFELGKAHLSLASGDPATGRYTVLWKEANGEWRAKIDFFAEDGWEG